MIIYNLFPLLAGDLDEWTPHLGRAADLGFDWIFVNPIQKPGNSGSLYSIKDYFAINPALIRPKSTATPEDQVRTMVGTAEALGLSMMIDLVI
ncbi:MAG: alpha-amylase, partial [Methylococcaceae bacterium]|nr:alpha-amylase [Methylococcaceae bacterium]